MLDHIRPVYYTTLVVIDTNYTGTGFEHTTLVVIGTNYTGTGFEHTTLVVIGTNYTGNQSNESACVNQQMSCLMSVLYIFWDRRDRDRMVVGITTTCVISAYHH
jgi:hypothetical protein